MSRPGTSLATLVALVISALTSGAPAQQPPPLPPAQPRLDRGQPTRTQPDAHPLTRQVRRLLAEGKVTDALKLTAQQRKADPSDPAVRSVYVELRMAIARQAVAAQKFQQAEALLKQVLAAQADHPTAGKMLAMIQQARGRIGPALADAGQLLRLERFEQSAALLAQAASLIPDQPQRWKPSWLAAVVGAGDDHYLMRNYEAALPFYAQALELAPAAEQGGADPARKSLLWRWSHCYAMNLARSATIRRTPARWAAIIEQAKDNFTAAQAELLGQYISALGRDNLGELGRAIAAYRQLLGAAAPPRMPNVAPGREVEVLRRKAADYVDSLNRSRQLDRRGGAWAAVLPGKPLTRKADRIVVHAHNDLVARRVLEAVSYHAPRLVAYLGGTPEDLKWAADYRVVIQPRLDSDSKLGRLLVPSYARIASKAGTLLFHETICYQRDPLLLGSTLPHELSHVLVSRLAGYPPVPLAIDEGLAIHAETTARYLMYHRAMMEAGGPKLTVAQLLAIEKLPPVGQRTRFYGECYNLVAWLLTQGRPAKVVDLCRLMRQAPPAPRPAAPALVALLKVYRFANLAAAERAYRTFLQDQGLIRPTPPGR